MTKKTIKKKKITSNHLLHYLGNFFIVLSLLGFSSVFLPIIILYLFPPTILPINQIKMKGTSITIPKIYAQSPIIEQVDPSNETEYLAALKEGVAQARGTSLPGQPGTIYLFAHSTGAPWDLTWSNTIFLRLGELQKGDEIEIERKGKVYKYKVRDKKVVDPSEVGYLLQTKRTQLILQTCTPIGTSLKRLLVFADPV